MRGPACGGLQSGCPAAAYGSPPVVRADVHRIAVPTPFQIGAVNVYLLEGDPLTLVDTGPNSGTAFVTLGLGAGILMSIQRHRKLMQS